MSTLHAWQQQVRERTASPWPGPRPMRADRDERSALVGRREDSKDFARLIYDTDVVIFTGMSGVGKSSMLQLDLVPTLLEAGYVVLVCDDWNRSSEATDVDDLIYRQAADQLSARARVSMRDGESLLDSLDALYPDRSVVVLDQFEELIRYQPREYRKVLRWIETAAADTRVRIVISLRVEYEHELRGHYGLRLGPFQQARFELRPLESHDVVRRIIRGGNDDRPTPAIADEAVDSLVAAWEIAADDDDSTARRGLLHLQALLFVLWMTKKGDRIESSDLMALRRQISLDSLHAGRDHGLTARSALFTHALAQAVQVVLDECAAACAPRPEVGWRGVDPVLASRARGLVQAMSGYLSSGGYKVSQAREDLAQAVIFREGASSPLARSIRKVEDARRRMAELVDSTRSTDHHVGRATPLDWLSIPRSEFLGRPAVHALPWELDPNEITGGVMLGLRPEDSLFEEYRSFYFGLEWLRLCDLVRLTTPYHGETMVTLIHDLFGDGLLNWSRQSTRGSESAVHQFTAIRGVEIDWISAEVRSPITESVVANLRWRSCDVRAEFRGVTFVNCDFRGTTFIGSSFDGVAFVNCMLDDAEFLDCTIIGSPPPPPPYNEPTAGASDKPPSFFVAHGTSALLRSLEWYREPREPSPERRTGLFSQMAGIAAVTAAAPPDARQTLLAPMPGGLSMFGGRVSSLKVRACDFGADGRMALRYVAGTSVEFADQVHARLDVHGTAIRGLTITRPVDAERPAPSDAGRFDITFTDSRIINLWFGVGLSGRATIADCRVWHVFNAADRADFQVAVSNSRLLGAVNVGPLDPVAKTEYSAASLGDLRDEVWQASLTIDYRRRPVRSELIDQPSDDADFPNS